MDYETIAACFPIMENEKGCWEWEGLRNNRGYGLTIDEGREWLAHRLIYTLVRGPIPSSLVLDHFQCGNKCCVNPAHLEPVTSAENTRRWNATRTSCKHGHELSGENLGIRKDGRRRCNTCYRAPHRKKKKLSALEVKEPV